MKKPSFTEALAQPVSDPNPKATMPAPAAPAAPAKPRDDRINTTLRISPEGLEALKIVAAGKRVRVNDLLLEGAEHILGLHGRKMQLRK